MKHVTEEVKRIFGYIKNFKKNEVAQKQHNKMNWKILLKLNDPEELGNLKKIPAIETFIKW